jgi:UDP-GlcNAc:undecaprenyl-phosphate GlcNAc-1-phosphate transferase
MGDSGSMLVGLLLAASVTSVTGQVSYGGIAGGDALPSLLPLAVPLMVLAVPFVDLALAVVRRTRAGRSPFSPDKQHLHHRLLEIGHSHVRAVLLMWMWAALLGFGGVLASFANSPLPVLAVFVLLTLLSLILVRYPGRRTGGVSHRRRAGPVVADRTTRPPVPPPNERPVASGDPTTGSSVGTSA